MPPIKWSLALALAFTFLFVVASIPIPRLAASSAGPHGSSTAQKQPPGMPANWNELSTAKQNVIMNLTHQSQSIKVAAKASQPPASPGSESGEGVTMGF